MDLARRNAAALARPPLRAAAAGEILANIDAMAGGVASVAPGETITVDWLLEMHRWLRSGSRRERHGGRLRTAQNWIGGSGDNPGSADFTPPPPEAVPALLDDLLAFCNDDGLPALAQAAIAHAQFETSHPFVDGNGRAGRALIHLALRRRGLAERFLPPVSRVLATWADDYVAGLTGTRYVGEPASAAAHVGSNRWVALFAGACRRVVADARWFEERVSGLQQDWLGRAGRPRRGSATRRLIDALPAAPVLTVATAAELIGRSFQATNLAIDRRVAAGALAPVNVGSRNRAFEAAELVDAFTALECRMASPLGDTLIPESSRNAPRGQR